MRTSKPRRRTILVGGVVAALALGAAVAAEPTPPINGPATATESADRGTMTTVSPPPAPTTVEYKVTINVEWSTATHPTTLPPGSHISPAVAASHGLPGDMFTVGSIATPGIEAMAERGTTSTLVTELFQRSTVSDISLGSSVFGAGTSVITVEATQTSDLLSLVTMLAPSPDWFVGIRAVDLFSNGVWTPKVQVDLVAYDAGTDSGVGFTSPNADTQPRQTVSGPRDPAFSAAAAEGRFGFVVIELVG